jgi:HPt (histidine-containing phosphotransfer) domain-containing protein
MALSKKEMQMNHQKDMKRMKVLDEEETKEEDILSVEELKSALESESVNGDVQFFWEVLEMTFTSAKSKLRAMNEAFEQGNFITISKLCHSLKGSAVMLGITRFAETAREGEDLFKTITSESEDDEKEDGIKSIHKLAKETDRIAQTLNKRQQFKFLETCKKD